MVKDETIEKIQKSLDNIEIKMSDLRFENARLKSENEKLIIENRRLKDKIEKVMKMTMKTDDSIALPTINHSVIFAVMEILEMDDKSDEEKFKSLKIYLRPSLEENPSQVYSIINGFKEDYDESSPILDKLSSWIKEDYEI